MKRVGAALSIMGVLAMLTGAIGVVGARAASSPTTFSGEGDSWPQHAVKQLETDVSASGGLGALSATYLGTTATGEDGAREDFVAGRSDFAVSGAPLSSDQVAAATTNGITPAYVPYAVGAVAVVVALTSTDGNTHQLITGLHFSLGTLAKIFTHAITKWQDREIFNENPDKAALLNKVDPAAQQIHIVVRADSSATTKALVGAFLADKDAAPIWKGYARVEGIPQDVPPDRWPADSAAATTGEVGGSAIVAQDMMNINPNTGQPSNIPDNSIGYLGLAWANQYHVPIVGVMNLNKKYVLPTSAAVTSAMTVGSTFDASTNLYSLSKTFDYSTITADDAYPIPLASYLIVPKAGAAAGKTGPLGNFVNFAESSAGQTDVANNGLVPVPAAVAAAGASVGAALSASAATTTTSTSTSTSTSSSTSTTSPSTTSTSRRSSSTTSAVAGGGGTPGTAAQSLVAASAGSGGAAQLPTTGGALSWLIAVLGLGLVGIGHGVRRRVQGPDP